MGNASNPMEQTAGPQSAQLRGDAGKLFLELSRVTKTYGGVTALDNVDFSCAHHSIHAVLGENGAGKSTLMKILSGVVRPDNGVISIEGGQVSIDKPRDAQKLGIATIFQELSLMPDLSVADNISITEATHRWGLFSARKQIERAEELLASIKCEDINPREKVESLSLSRRQMVEIAKALSRHPKLLILDEATSALTGKDVDRVFELLVKLRDEGKSILYISHRMHEIEALADTCTVFRNGKSIETFRTGAKTPDEIVQLMIGRSISQVYPEKRDYQRSETAGFEVSGLNWEDRLKQVNLSVGRGEIVGLGGLEGQGQRELLLAAFGVLRGVSGEIAIDGKPVSVGSPKKAKSPKIGLAMIPEDRKSDGLLLPMSIRDNISLAAIGRLSRWGVISRGDENALIDQMTEKLSIKLNSLSDAVATLSGGNQQKVVIAKWLAVGPRCLLLMDPTRGIDVGTKQEIYKLLRSLADQGVSILFYSTDVDELVGLCDRVSIFYNGEIIRELTGSEINESNIIATSLNWAVSPADAAVGDAES